MSKNNERCLVNVRKGGRMERVGGDREKVVVQH
jgi:hypothetical protein